MADQEISVVITAKDEASPTIAALTKKVAKLEKDPATLLLTTNATKISRQMVDLLRQVDKLDASDPEITVKTNQINALQGDLNQIESKLREINQIPVGGNVDELGRSANSSKSALANMIGNSAQDVGQLGHIAGSTGVAIGQMAEYMADAALEGEGFGKVIGNFAKVAGPIAAVSIGVGLISSAMTNARKEAEASRKRIREYAEAFRETGTDAAGALDLIRSKLAEGSDEIDKTVTKLDELGKGYGDIVTAALGGADAQQKFIDSAIEAAGLDVTTGLSPDGIKRQENAVLALTKQIRELFGEIAAGQDLEVVKFDATQFRILANELERMADPLSKFPHMWNLVMAGLTGGDMDRAARAAVFLGKMLGLAPEEVLATAKAAMDDYVDVVAEGAADAADAAEEETKRLTNALGTAVVDAINAHTRAVDDWVDKHRRFVRAMEEARRAAEEYADPVEAAARATRALNDAFAEHDSIIATREQIVDVRDALRDLAQFIQRDMKGTIPNLLDPNDVNAGPYLDRFRRVRDAVQDRLTEVFSEGGPDAAKNWAERQITQIEKTLGGRLTREQIREMLGWEDLEVTLQVAVDKKSAADAELLGKAVTAPLEVIGVTEAIEVARAEVAVKTKQSPFEIPIKFTPANPFDAGGIVGPQGGIVAERRPEIVNSKWLVTQPTVVPPGTRVTSGARTARILRTRGTAGLRRYDAGGVVAGARSININVNAAVVGNRYDVMRAVKRAARDSDRLLGSRA